MVPGSDMQVSPSYQRYLQWLEANGARFPRVPPTQLQYPASFHGTTGVSAAVDIPPHTAFLFIPYSLCFSLVQAQSSPIHPALQAYNTRYPYESNDDQLRIYLTYERLQGALSFFYPYFQVVEIPANLLIDWSPTELNRLNNPWLSQSVPVI